MSSASIQVMAGGDDSSGEDKVAVRRIISGEIVVAAIVFFSVVAVLAIVIAAMVFFFMIVVLVLFSFLYASRRMRSALLARSWTHHFVFPTTSSGSHDDDGCGVEATVLRSLPATVFWAADFEEDVDCAVCLSELADGEAARLLPKCGHGFHLDCIDVWLRSNSTCPLCRGRVVGAATNASANRNTGARNRSTHAP